jgi:hypothetical protein
MKIVKKKDPSAAEAALVGKLKELVLRIVDEIDVVGMTEGRLTIFDHIIRNVTFES